MKIMTEEQMTKFCTMVTEWIELGHRINAQILLGDFYRTEIGKHIPDATIEKIRRGVSKAVARGKYKRVRDGSLKIA